MNSTVDDLARYHDRIVDDAVRTFEGTNIFSGQDRPSDVLARAASEGLLDLLMEPSRSRDPHTVKLFMEWLYNLIRKDSKKTDTTIEFLDTFKGIVTRYLDNKEDIDVKAFFESCKDMITQRHKELLRKAP